jgi:hypothetical protein
MRSRFVALALVVACQRDTLRPRLDLAGGFTATFSIEGGYPPSRHDVVVTSDGHLTRSVDRITERAGAIVAPTELVPLLRLLESVAFADLAEDVTSTTYTGVPDAVRLSLVIETHGERRVVGCTECCREPREPEVFCDAVHTMFELDAKAKQP